MVAFVLLGPPRGNEVAIYILLLAIFAAAWILTILFRQAAARIWKGKARMKELVSDYRSLIRQALPKLQAISDPESSVRPSPNKWSKKEILGHLIDSASNNHQRFVRLQLSGEIKLPGYDQEAWVKTQDYKAESWEDLVCFWKLFNFHLLHIIKEIPADKLNGLCFIGEKEPITLESLAHDYLEHLKHHLDQIFA